MTAHRGKILVIRGGAIGDFILTLPVLAALRAQFPGTRLEVLGYPHIANLALLGEAADRVQSIEARELAGFFAKGGALAPALAEYFAGFHLIISFLYDPDRIFQTNVARCTPAQFLAGPHRPDERGALHATETFLQPLQQLAIFDAPLVPKVPVTPSFSESLTTGRWLAVHPGSGSERKNWPLEHWAELLRQLVADTHLNFLHVGGEADRDRLARLERVLPPIRRRQLQNVPLPEVAAWLASCRAFIGHDSGISHLAAAVDLPLLLLWGDTVEHVWRPRARQLTLLRGAQGLSALSVPVVRHHLEILLANL